MTRLQPLRGSVAGGAQRHDPHVFDIPNMPKAVCRTEGVMPDTWHHDDLRSAAAKAETAAAIALCKTCPEIEPCLAYAINHRIDEGIFGGLTPDQRRALRRKTRS